MRWFVIVLAGVLLSHGLTSRNLGGSAMASELLRSGRAMIAIDRAGLLLAPYVWKRTGSGPSARIEATMPGAYLKGTFRGSASVALVVDGSANHGCPAESMPVVEYSVDEGPFRTVQLEKTDAIYPISMAEGLEQTMAHRFDVYFRAGDLTRQRWESPISRLRVAGIATDRDGTLVPRPARPGRAIVFGDSITEGVGVDGLFTSWQKLEVNNARATWSPLVAMALDCEYGQLGSGGLGMTRTLNLPPLPRVWDHYDAATSRLTGGLLLPEPDHVFCALGTNDYEKDITADYAGWLTATRRACPRARIFCIVPTLGVHAGEIRSAVEARNAAGDARVHLVDPARLAPGFRSGRGPTQLAHDGVHPSEYGQAMLGALIAVDVQKILDQGR